MFILVFDTICNALGIQILFDFYAGVVATVYGAGVIMAMMLPARVFIQLHAISTTTPRIASCFALGAS